MSNDSIVFTIVYEKLVILILVSIYASISNASICLSKYVCIYACIHVSILVSMYVPMYVPMYVFICLSIIYTHV